SVREHKSVANVRLNELRASIPRGDSADNRRALCETWRIWFVLRLCANGREGNKQRWLGSARNSIAEQSTNSGEQRYARLYAFQVWASASNCLSSYTNRCR